MTNLERIVWASAFAECYRHLRDRKDSRPGEGAAWMAHLAVKALRELSLDEGPLADTLDEAREEGGE